MESGSLDFLLHSETIWQFKLEFYRLCKTINEKSSEPQEFRELSKSISKVNVMTIYEIAQVTILLHLSDLLVHI